MQARFKPHLRAQTCRRMVHSADSRQQRKQVALRARFGVDCAHIWAAAVPVGCMICRLMSLYKAYSRPDSLTKGPAPNES